MASTLFLPGSSTKHDLRQRDGFETFREAERRRACDIRLLEAANDRECTLLARKLRRCKKGKRCRSWACDVCVRLGRVWYGNAAAEPFAGTPALAVTIALAGCSLPAGGLPQADTKKLKDLCRKRVDRAGLGDRLVIGAVEWSANSDSATPNRVSWVPQLHLTVSADPSKTVKEDASLVRERLKAVFPKGDGVPRPVKVVPVHDLLGWLSYGAKPYFEARVGYVGGNGRRQTKDQSPRPKEQREALLYTDRVSLLDRLFLRNVRRAGRRFVVRNGTGG